MNLTAESRDYLIALAQRSIRRGTTAPDAGPPELSGCPPEALAHRACFVTLSTAAQGLRGCRGSLEPNGPLAAAVWRNAWASAFDDARFSPVARGELAGLAVEVSVLGPLERLLARTEQELHQALVPRSDGVLLAWRGWRATFLPQVWEKLPDPREFLAQLKLKAGLPPDFWAADIEIHRYRIASFHGRADCGIPLEA